MEIHDVMRDTANAFGAEFTFFGQVEHPWPGMPQNAAGQEGVCLALAMKWVASGGQVAYVRAFNDDAGSAKERSNVAAIQAAVPATDLAGRDHFIKREMDRLGYSDIGETMLSLPLMTMAGKMNDASKYLPEVGRNIVALIPDSGALISIISPSGGSSNQHATAIYRPGDGRAVSFFDPNGGVLAFADLDNAGKWFAEKLPTATRNDYDKITSVKIRKFRKKPA